MLVGNVIVIIIYHVDKHSTRKDYFSERRVDFYNNFHIKQEGNKKSYKENHTRSRQNSITR